MDIKEAGERFARLGRIGVTAEQVMENSKLVARSGMSCGTWIHPVAERAAREEVEQRSFRARLRLLKDLFSRLRP